MNFLLSIVSRTERVSPQLSVPELSGTEERCVPSGHSGRGRHRAGSGLHVHVTPGAQPGQRSHADGDRPESAGHKHTLQFQPNNFPEYFQNIPETSLKFVFLVSQENLLYRNRTFCFRFAEHFP